jgi:hypothetical protein
VIDGGVSLEDPAKAKPDDGTALKKDQAIWARARD